MIHLGHHVSGQLGIDIFLRKDLEFCYTVFCFGKDWNDDMWLKDWTDGLFVELPPRADAESMSSAEKALREIIEKIIPPKPTHDSGARFQRSSRSTEYPEIRYSLSDCVAESGKNRYLPKARFTADDTAPKAISKQIAAKPKCGNSFAQELVTFVRTKCNGIAPMAYKRAGVSRQVYSRIISSASSRVDKITAMRLCIGLQLNFNESANFLKAAGYAFSDSLPLDAIFTYCIKNRFWNILDVNRLIASSGQQPLDIVF